MRQSGGRWRNRDGGRRRNGEQRMRRDVVLSRHLLAEVGARREELEVLVARVGEDTCAWGVRLGAAEAQWGPEGVVLAEGRRLPEGEDGGWVEQALVG